MIVHTTPVEDRLLATVCEVDRDVVFEIVERLDKVIVERESVIVDLNDQLRELAKVIVEKDDKIDSLKEEVCSLERDEALRVVREQHAEVIGLYAMVDESRNERDQLRKVCDELANATRAEFGELNWRLDAYNNLPPET